MEGDLEFGDVNPLAAAIREAIGVGPYDRVRVRGPQFEREDGCVVTVRPTGTRFLDALRTASESRLTELGMRQWDGDLWLFPGEWYAHIPADYPVVNIFDEEAPFRPGKTSNDIRFGCLAYGIRRMTAP